MNDTTLRGIDDVQMRRMLGVLGVTMSLLLVCCFFAFLRRQRVSTEPAPAVQPAPRMFDGFLGPRTYRDLHDIKPWGSGYTFLTDDPPRQVIVIGGNVFEEQKPADGTRPEDSTP